MACRAGEDAGAHATVRRERRTFYVEPPVLGVGPARVDVAPTREKVWTLTLRAPEGEGIGGELPALVAAELAARSVEQPVVWFDAVDAVELAGGVEASTIVYDVESDLRPLADAERVVLAISNVVLAATPALYERARGHHPRVVLLVSAADDAGWDATWAEMLACLAARIERTSPSTWPSPRDTLSDEELAEETQPVLCIPT